MKVSIELNLPDDRVFLNYWNWFDGDDVVCQVREGRLFLQQHDDSEKEIELSEFIEMVKQRAEQSAKG